MTLTRLLATKKARCIHVVQVVYSVFICIEMNFVAFYFICAFCFSMYLVPHQMKFYLFI